MTQSCFNELFIDFNELSAKHLKFKASIVVWAFQRFENCSPKPDAVSLAPELHRWCRENHIRYRKVSINSSIKNANNKEIARFNDERHGLLFYHLEDATAFKLRWL